MQLRTILVAAVTAATLEASVPSDLFAQPPAPGLQPAATAGEGKIDHKPLERTPRGGPIVIRAQVKDPARLFSPLVFARSAGSERFAAYSMSDRGNRGFVARLPSAMLDEGSFEYFIEARHDEGEPTRFASPTKPIVCVAFDPPARPVKATFRSDEPGATLKIDDNEAGKTPITVALGPGPHVIQLIAPDGRSTEQQIDVKPGRKLDVVVPLPSRAGGPASLGVTSDPPGARVFLDGASVGVTPYAIELAPGSHAVAVESAGRLRQERQITARQGRDVQLAFVLPAMPKEPALTVESEPAGAAVIIDGKERGRTPFLAPVAPGKHELVLRIAGRRELGTEFEMPKDKDVSRRLDLSRPSVGGPRLTIASSPEGATVLVDGKQVGLTPWNGEVKLGERAVQVRRDGYVVAERTITMQANRDMDLSLALERIAGPGQLRVETEPADAEIAIDGKAAGVAPYAGELSSGDHSVEVSSVGYRTLAQQITLAPGQQVSLRLTLSPAGGDNAPPIVGVNSAPEGALLYLDGKLIGPTPKKAQTTPGQHELRLVLDGYKTWSAPTRVPDKAGFELRVAIALKPLREAEAHDAPAAVELARAQYKRAEACYAAGDYACATAGYRAAYDYSHRPELLFNLAQAHRRGGNLKEALESYQSFLREKSDPNPKVKKQAEQYVAFCQLVLQPAQMKPPAALLANATPPAEAAPPPPPLPASAGALSLPAPPPPGTPPLPTISEGTPALAVALPAEDTQPPVVTHSAVRNVVSGKPLRIVARIVDEHSAVGDAQACWRNLFHIEYECYPLKPGANDEFEAVVPGNAVADGFAYYLEAWDSQGNGPARSGTPQSPHSVAVSEAETPARIAVAEAVGAAATPGTILASQRSPMGASPAAAPLDRQVQRFPSDFEGKERPSWAVSAYGGAERSSEDDTDAIVQSRFGIEASRVLAARTFAVARFDWRSGKQPYVPDPGANPNQRITLDEQRYDATLGAGYDFGNALWGDDVSLVPTLGLSYLGIRNGTFPVDLIGPDVGAQARFHLFWRLSAQAAFAYAYNLASPETRSALGTIKGHISSRGGLLLPLGRFAVSLDYRNDILSFSHTYRVAHGATLGFGSSF